MLIALEQPVNRRYLQPKSPFHNALKQAELTGFKFLDARSIKKTLAKFLLRSSVEGLNSVSVDYMREQQQALDEPTEFMSEAAGADKANRLAPVLEDYEEECFDTRITPEQFFRERATNDQDYRWAASNHLHRFETIFENQVKVWGLLQVTETL